MLCFLTQYVDNRTFDKPAETLPQKLEAFMQYEAYSKIAFQVKIQYICILSKNKYLHQKLERSLMKIKISFIVF